VLDVLVHRNAAAWRGLGYLLLTGSSCVLMTGLPQVLMPSLPAPGVEVLKASLGPLSGALTLTYLGVWLGVAAEDGLVHACITWGSPFLVISTLLLLVLFLAYPQNPGLARVFFVAPMNAVAVGLAIIASVRASLLGDLMARWMVLASIFLAVMVGGLYWHDNLEQQLGVIVLLFIAFCTLAYFVVVIALSFARNRVLHGLENLAALPAGTDRATGLPKGSVLLSKVDDAFWRSARRKRNCTVICLHFRNLYALGEQAGHHVDQQILTAMGARLRRAVGFRSVVGLYHPRCFVVVISAIEQPKTVARALARLNFLMIKPLTVVGTDDAYHTFIPNFGMGLVTVQASNANPAAVIDEAEKIAMADDTGLEDAGEISRQTAAGGL
jgi:GGDEF domain-containing protein